MGHMGSIPWISLFALIAIAIGSLSSTSKYRFKKMSQDSQQNSQES